MTIPPSLSSARRILVVDDHADAAEGLAFFLRLHGHETRTAEDGVTALDLARTFHPEIIVLDIGLPRMDGYEVARRLRDEHPNGLLLVAATGYGKKEDRRRATEAGFDHVLVKPISLDALLPLLVSIRSLTSSSSEDRPTRWQVQT